MWCSRVGSGLLGVQLDDQLLLHRRRDLRALGEAQDLGGERVVIGLQRVEVFAKGAGSGRETAIRSLQAAGLEVTTVKDVTPQAHNGCRPRKRRRV